MKKTTITATAYCCLMGLSCVAQEFPPMAEPEKQHKLLQELAGKWEGEAEVSMGPGQPTMKLTTTETIRTIGPFWMIAESEGTLGDMPVHSMLTLGYDPKKEKIVGTWIDSFQAYLWTYEGSFDETGKILTLETKGPCPLRPGELTNFREVLELKDKDHKVFTSSMQQEDGTWTEMVTVEYRKQQ